MLMYFIIFSIVGFIIGKSTINENNAIGLIILIAIIWSIVYAPIWGLTSLGEMALGYFISRKIK